MFENLKYWIVYETQFVQIGTVWQCKYFQLWIETYSFMIVWILPCFAWFVKLSPPAKESSIRTKLHHRDPQIPSNLVGGKIGANIPQELNSTSLVRLAFSWAWRHWSWCFVLSLEPSVYFILSGLVFLCFITSNPLLCVVLLLSHKLTWQQWKYHFSWLGNLHTCNNQHWDKTLLIRGN